MEVHAAAPSAWWRIRKMLEIQQVLERVVETRWVRSLGAVP